MTLRPGGEAALETSVSLAVHSTRMSRPGRHAVDVIVNGKVVPLGTLYVTATAPR